MGGLERTRPVPQPGLARAGVLHGVEGTGEEIEGESPVGQVGEVGEGATRRLLTTVRSIPAEGVEDGDEGVDGEEQAGARQEPRREQPRGGVALGGIKGSRHPERELGVGAHHDDATQRRGSKEPAKNLQVRMREEARSG